jgi:hypothetical protein
MHSGEAKNVDLVEKHLKTKTKQNKKKKKKKSEWKGDDRSGV